MDFYLIGSEEGFNELRFTKVEDWQKYMGIGASISKDWEPVKLEYIYGGKSKKDKNFDISQSCDPLFTISERALKVLEKIITKSGEILDIESPKGYYFFHCTNILNALIKDKSDIIWLDKEQGWISGINKFVLDKNKIQGQEIFRLPDANCRYTFFGDEFKSLVKENRLKGIHFERYETIIFE